MEVELTEEEKAELKFFEDFMASFTQEVEKAKQHLNEYRAMIDPITGVEKVALWPKVFSFKEIEKMKREEEKRLKREEEAAEELRR